MLSWSARDPDSKGIAINNGPEKNVGSSGRAKGVITRNFERLDDEFLLHEVSIGSDRDNGFASAGKHIIIDREFGINTNDELLCKGSA